MSPALPAEPLPDLPMATLRGAKFVNALLGGSYADAPERRDAEEMLRQYPVIRSELERARQFHARAATWAVTHGRARGVVFGAAMYPHDPLPHTAALKAAPSARFVYCDPDDRITFFNQMLAGPNVTAVQASLRDPVRLMDLPEVAAMGAPLSLQAGLAGCYWPDQYARALMAHYAALLPARSSIVLSVLIPDRGPAGEQFTRMLTQASGAQVYAHTPEAVASWLRGAGFRLSGTGVSDIHVLGRRWKVRPRRHAPPARIVEAVARRR